VARAEQPELFNLVRTLFHAYTEAGDEIDLDTPPPAWELVEKFDLGEPFLQMVKATFGYSEDNPSLRNLMLRLLVADLAQHLRQPDKRTSQPKHDDPFPESLRHLLLPASGWSNAVVCLAQWRDSASKGGSYDRLSALAAAVLKIEDHLSKLE